MAALCLAAAASAAWEVPAGTVIGVRLKTKVADATAKPKDAVEAEVIAPVVVDGRFLVPAGAAVHGAVESAKPATKPDERAALLLDFTGIEIGGQTLKLAAKVAAVGNARETVDEQGQIVGILAAESISSRLDQGIARVAQRFEGLAEILGAAKGAILKPPDTGIVYDPGVEMELKLTAALRVERESGPGPSAKLESLTDPDLVGLVTAQPYQTVAQNPPKPSDITNVMLIGTRERVEAAFQAAGWSTAAALSAQSKLETFRAIAEQRGYKEAPVSILLLDGKPPDLVFEKQNNTFAQRHHLRVWLRPDGYRDLPVWLVAATHDTGIEFSPENRTFIHRIDPKIDRERAKVVNDLVLTGLVQGLALVERPQAPKSGRNATGDQLETDGQMAVLQLK